MAQRRQVLNDGPPRQSKAAQLQALWQVLARLRHADGPQQCPLMGRPEVTAGGQSGAFGPSLALAPNRWVTGYFLALHVRRRSADGSQLRAQATSRVLTAETHKKIQRWRKK